MDVENEIDLTLALQLQAQFQEELRASLLQQEREATAAKNKSYHGGKTYKKRSPKELEEPRQEKLSVSLIDPSWELIDPNPDIHQLFLQFNDQFFWRRLSSVEVRWSPRMTLCAGVCSYEGRSGLCSVRLSLPLLKLRPRKDLIETLLHEMIHAYLFVTANNKDHDGHGPEFHKHMYRINNVAGTKISVYHTFHDEVDVYRQHIWQCDGPCRQRRPYYGLVKRSMNRVPGPRDPWWSQHQQTCGGSYTKIKEPEGYGAKKRKSDSKVSDQKKLKSCGDIRKFISFEGEGRSLSSQGKVSGAGTSSHGQKGQLSRISKSPKDKENQQDKFSNGTVHSKNATGKKSSELSNGNVQNFVSSSGKVTQAQLSKSNNSNVSGLKNQSFIKSSDNGKVKSRKTHNGGQSMKTFTGSRSSTVTVTKKGTSTETEKSGSQSSAPERAFTPFKGTGHALGGGSNVSKLLNLNDKKKEVISNKEKNMSSRRREDQNLVRKKDCHRTGSTETESSLRGNKNQVNDDTNSELPCPVCKNYFPASMINNHLDKCLDSESEELSMKPGTSKNKARECETDIQKKSRPDEVTLSGEEITYPCPVCQELVSPERMNEHLDTHF
ncbi:DNA-dependent metalloprotease SPRTN [Oratosquilla oratoria]|uniref:DNA-dependent metalloprotease SPRTN n=1 Tax=Oratosquilla oratoria TaxID=337810 RepID=UPI003F75A126